MHTELNSAKSYYTRAAAYNILRVPKHTILGPTKSQTDHSAQ